MGYRLHYAQTYQPIWKGGYFNWDSDKFADLVRAEFEQNHWMNEEESAFELDRTAIIEYVDKLLKDPNQVNKYFNDPDIERCYTNKEVSEVFTEILKSDDDTIHMEWF